MYRDCNRRLILEILDAHLLDENLEEIRLELRNYYHHSVFQTVGNITGNTKRSKLICIMNVLDSYGAESICDLCNAAMNVKPDDRNLETEIRSLCNRIEKEPSNHSQEGNYMNRAIIFTAIPIEYEAVKSHLTDLTQVPNTIYERGTFQNNSHSWEVIIVETGVGNISAAIETERAIKNFRPVVTFFVGIAGGLKDVGIGDVVAATKVYGYEYGEAEKKFSPRPEVGASSYILEQRARYESRRQDWLERTNGTNLNKSPRVFVGPIAAGEKLVKSMRSSTFKFLRSHYSDALAVEMEGIGFLKAARANEVNALVIRGISDLINKKEESDAAGSQAIAASHAIAFAFQILSNLVPMIQVIGSDLNFIHDFREKTYNVENRYSREPIIHFEQEGRSLQVRKQGKIENTIEENRFNHHAWDDIYYETLRKRIRTNWEIYNQIYGELPEKSADEKARLNQVLKRHKDELCDDFLKLIRLFEDTIGVSLNEYRLLYEVCGNSS